MEDKINELTQKYGIFVRGSLSNEMAQFPGKTLYLLGNTSELTFSFSTEQSLDQWTKEILDAAAKKLGAKVIYAFDGPPFFPFQQWALLCDDVHSSPINLLIHPQFGLWHAYRAAFCFEESHPTLKKKKTKSPCEDCLEKPCLISCPGEAFTPHWELNKCIDSFKKDVKKTCVYGCLARLSCPIGTTLYNEKQRYFHQNHFFSQF